VASFSGISVALVRSERAMMRIQTRVEPMGTVTVLVAGTLNATSVAEFDRVLEEARRLEQPVVLDLSHVRLIDRPTLKYLIDLMEHDVRLVICPDYVEQWIQRESMREASA
jgi:hypothetical protein